MVKSRVVIIFLGLVILWAMLFFKAAHVQILPNQRLSQLQKKQFKKRVTLKPRRGHILDRNGKKLAISISSYSLFADPSMIKDRYKVSHRLAKVLKVSPRFISKKIKNKKRRFVWLQRQLSKEMKNKIKDLRLKGLGFIQEPKRVYPNGDLLAQTLGVVGSNDSGLEGLELKYDEELKGLNKKIKLERDARGRPLVLDGRIFSQKPEGSHLQLTIDEELQYILERELANAVDKHEAKSAVGVILNVENSEILAMANVPTYDVNKARSYSRKLWRNRAVTDAYEPGSTFKTFVIAAALKDDLVKPNTKFFCENGRFKVGRRYINEADEKHHFGWLSVSEILANSSNIGTTKIAFKVGDKNLREGLINFGFGVRSDIGLPGESKGVLQKLPWRPHLLSNISFGHGVTVTPIQIANAYAAIANGGVLKKPLLVKTVISSNGEEEEVFSSKKIRRVLSEEKSKIMRLMLTASAAPTSRIIGFPVAGKTGTAQKIRDDGRGYERGAYIASYAGFAPANDPKFVIYVAVDTPKNRYYGSEVAAPVFSKVAQFAVNKYRLAPILITEKNVVKEDREAQIRASLIEPLKTSGIESSLKNNIVPDLKGLSLRQVVRELSSQGIKVNIRGTGAVVKQSPLPGEVLTGTRQVKLYLSEKVK